MRLPYELWKNTLRKLGLRFRKVTRTLPAHRRPRNAQLEVLERREVLAAEIDVQDSTMISIADDTGTSSFGSTMVGMSVTKTFAIKNTGMDSLSIDTGSFSLPSGFTLTQSPSSTVAAMSQTSFTVRLDAQAEGTYSGFLAFSNGDSNESPYNFTISGTVTGNGTSPEIEVQNSSLTTIPDGTGSEGFGTTTVGTPVSQTFTVKNTGMGTLTINTGSFSLPSGFTLTQSPSSSVSMMSQTSFTVRLDAATAGSYSGQISFGNNDGNENPYNFTISGTVNSGGGSAEIALQNAAATPIADGTGSESFGSTAVGTSVSKTFTILNQGTSALSINTGSFSLPSGFTLTQFPASSVAASASTSFTVRLDAAAAGSYSGEVLFANGDADESPYNFTISGTVTGGSPEIDVADQAMPIVDEYGTHSFGSTPAGTAVSSTFTIQNTGTAALSIDTGSFSLPSGYTLTQAPVASVAPSGSTTFIVRLDASASGSYSGQLSFANGDANENPYNFQLTGSAYIPGPEINLQNSSGSSIPDGSGSQAFGATEVGIPVSKSFTIQNLGPSSLSIDVGSFSLPAGYTLTTAPASSVSGGGSTSFTVRLNATTAGSYSGQISFGNGDSDENPYNFAISGEVEESAGALSASVGLLNDTGSSSTDLVTSDPTLEAAISGEFAYAKIQFDVNGDGFSDGELAYTAPDTPQTYDPTSYNSQLETYEGEVTIKHRWVHYSAPGGSVLGTGSWTPFTFTLEHPPEVEVFVDGNVAVPDDVGSISFGSTDLELPLTKTLTIKNEGVNTLNIGNLGTPPAGFSIDTANFNPQLGPGQQTSLTIQLDAEEDGVFSGEFSFTSNDPDESPYTFTLSGQVTNLQPEIEVRLNTAAGAIVEDSDAVDWGTTGEGTALTRTFTIINLGTEALDLDVNSLILPTGFSLISPFAAQVAPYGGQTAFTVQLDADDPGAYHGFLTFDSDDEDEANFTIWASGIVNGEGWTGPDVAVNGLALVNDTGHSSTDLATYDPRVSATVGGDFAGGSVDVQFEHNGDGLIDGIVHVPSSGSSFTYDPRTEMAELAGFVGPLTLRYRPVPLDSNGNSTSVGAWSQLEITMLATPGAGNLRIRDRGLVADTGASTTDKLTVDPRLFFVVGGDLEGGSARIELDHNGDGTPEGSLIATNNTSEYVYDPRVAESGYLQPVGQRALSYRLIKRNAAGEDVASGGWDTFRFTVENVPASTWTVSGFDLAVDNGSSDSDNISSNPTLAGTATGSGGPPSNSLALPKAIVQFDLTGDDQPDAEMNTDQAGAFTFLPGFASYGEKSVRARVKQWSPAYHQYLLGAWGQPLAFEFAADQPAAVTNLHRATSDNTPAGMLSNLVAIGGSSSPQLKIEFETTGDATPEGSTFSDENGNFQFEAPGLAAGERTIRVRAARYDALLGQFVAGTWALLTVTVEAFALPSVTGLHLVSDTGSSSTDKITIDSTLAGTLTGDNVAGFEIEFDHNGNGTPDGSTYAGTDGSFQYRPAGLPVGASTVKVRTIAWDANLGALATSEWASFAFSLEAASFQSASFTALTLARDTGASTSDGITTDSTIGGSLSAGAFTTIEFDHNGDGTPDGSTVTGGDAKFNYVPIGIALGSHTLRARTKEWNYLTRQGQFSAWQPITFTLQAPQNAVPAVSSLGLRADTGASGSDGYTANAMLYGQVSNDQPNQRLVVEIDHNGDGVGEGLAFTDLMGNFSYSPEPLAFGPVTLHARAIEWNALTGQYQASAWQSVSFHYENQPSAPAALLPISLTDPISSGSTTTRNPGISGRIINAGALAGIGVEVDTDASGTPDQTAITDALGNYNLDLAVQPGAVNIQVRTREIEAGTGQVLYSGWTAFAFTFQQPTNAAPGLSTFTLQTDTGASNSDGITTDATLKGTAINDGSVGGLTVVFDHNNDNVADGTATTDANGHFEYVPAGLTFGAQSIRARVKELDAEGVAQYGVWQSLSFTYQDAALVELRIDTLELTNDTGESDTDGATADGAVGGHVANAGGQAVTLEIDKDGNGTVDATVTASAETGNFSYSPTGLANGLVTIRARVQAAAGEAVKPWSTLNFVLHTSPHHAPGVRISAGWRAGAVGWFDGFGVHRLRHGDGPVRRRRNSRPGQRHRRGRKPAGQRRPGACNGHRTAELQSAGERHDRLAGVCDGEWHNDDGRSPAGRGAQPGTGQCVQAAR